MRRISAQISKSVGYAIVGYAHTKRWDGGQMSLMFASRAWCCCGEMVIWFDMIFDVMVKMIYFCCLA